MSAKPVALVLGLGKSGLASARYLASTGYSVVAVDKNDGSETHSVQEQLPAGTEIRLGPYAAEVVDGADLVCPSPGVPWDAPELRRARDLGIPIASEMELFFAACKAHIIGITGTNGKTTTTALIASILRHAGLRTHMGGNIGTTVVDRVHEFGPADWVVVELSSFQLESTSRPACDVAVVLNLTPDHLDRHKTMEAYAEIKAKLVRHAKNCAVLNRDDPIVAAMAAQARCEVRFFARNEDDETFAFISGDRLQLRGSRGAEPVMDIAGVPLFGSHNLENVLAAICAADAAGVSHDRIAAAVAEFRPVEHRLQTVLDSEGVLWINDSKATNADSAIKALTAFDRPIVWIGGGYHKGVPATELAAAVAAQARHALLIGTTAAELDTELGNRGFVSRTLAGTLENAVGMAAELARPGDVVLFSPGYASFDQFKNFGDRGERFITLVQALTMASAKE